MSNLEACYQYGRGTDPKMLYTVKCYAEASNQRNLQAKIV